MTEAPDIYKQSDVYHNEAARTYYKLGQVLSELNIVQEAKVASETAEELRTGVMKDKWLPATSEEDFDILIVFWSR